MYKLGTNYGGWYIPNNLQINENSIIYGVGVGEDISFDLGLQDKFNCNIFLIDPTNRAINHYNEIKEFFKNKNSFKFSGNIQKDYINKISNLNINFDKINYINKGLWNQKTTMKFYKQSNSNYVSQSLIENMFSNNYDIVDVDTISNIMIENNHNKIDLLKLDIEGAEIEVLNNMLENNIYPKYLLVEFDLLIKNKDKSNLTKILIKKLLDNEYKIIFNDNFNITFELNK